MPLECNGQYGTNQRLVSILAESNGICIADYAK